jgi:PGF-CTERM protein
VTTGSHSGDTRVDGWAVAAVVSLLVLAVPALAGHAQAVALSDTGGTGGPTTPLAGDVTVADATVPEPIARCDVSKATIAPGESVTLDASASENATQYRYDKEGDGTFGDWRDTETATVSYDQAGTYEPQVRVMSPADFTETASCGTVTVESPNDPPAVTLSYSPTEPAPNEQVTVTADASDGDGEVVRYEWYVDDEFIVASPDPEFGYVFEETGDHTVGAVAEDDDGATTSASVTVTIVQTDNEPPIVQYTYSPAEPALDETVTFDSQSSDPDGEVVEYEWTVDGEPVGDEPGLEYTFGESGEHTVALTVTDDDGTTATTSKTVVVGENQPPRGEVSVTAAWWYAPIGPQAGESVTLVADGPGDSRITYRWSVGEESPETLTGQVVNYAFPGPGEYTVTLEAVGPDGETRTQSKTVTVEEAPSGSGGEGGGKSFWMAPADPRPGETVTMIADLSDGSATEYRWDLDGDGSTDKTGEVVSYTFPENTRVTVTLETIDESGTTSTSSTTVSTRGEDPVDETERSGPSIWVTAVNPQPGETVTLVATPQLPDREVEEYRWDLNGDGQTDRTGEVVDHSFPEDGRISVSLTVVQTDGSTTSVDEDVAVGNPTPTPTDETPTDETPTDETPTDETPTDETPTDETPTDETPTDETPTDETPTDGSGGPGLGVVAALVALLCAALLVARRTER